MVDDPRLPAIDGGETMVASLRRQLAEAIDGLVRRVRVDEERREARQNGELL
jgi:hypothetical protein